MALEQPHFRMSGRAKNSFLIIALALTAPTVFLVSQYLARTVRGQRPADATPIDNTERPGSLRYASGDSPHLRSADGHAATDGAAVARSLHPTAQHGTHSLPRIHDAHTSEFTHADVSRGSTQLAAPPGGAGAEYVRRTSYQAADGGEDGSSQMAFQSAGNRGTSIRPVERQQSEVRLVQPADSAERGSVYRDQRPAQPTAGAPAGQQRAVWNSPAGELPKLSLAAAPPALQPSPTLEPPPAHGGGSLLQPLQDLLSPNQAQPFEANQGTTRVPMAQSVSPDAIQLESENGLVSIVVRDAPLNEVLNLLAQHRGLSLIAAEDITARLSVTLRDQPFEHALTQILSVAGYTWTRQGDILVVTSISAGNTLTPQTQGRTLRVFSLDYVSAVDVDNVVKGLISSAGKSFVTESSGLDNRRTQELLVVEDLPEYLQRIEQYVLQVDRPPRQVLIEARILAIELDDDLKHGINWQYLDKIGIPQTTLQIQGFADAAKFAAGTSPAFFFNIASSDLNALVEALETTKDAKTLATPKVLALNGQEARIQIGQQLGYRVTTTTQTSTLENVDFLDVGVVLRVTPRISRDNQVLMQVKPEVSSGQINPDTQLPEEETTEVETAVMLPSGYGMVIGGLIQEEDTETQQKVPFLGDIRFIGRLFQKRNVIRNRTEIVIALIPHIVPYQPMRQELECQQFTRASTPLTYGPLIQNPRPSEPRFPDAGQCTGPAYKLKRFCPPVDSQSWRPGGPTDPCLRFDSVPSHTLFEPGFRGDGLPRDTGGLPVEQLPVPPPVPQPR